MLYIKMNHKNQDVLEFYKILPFNVYGDISTAVNQIKKTDPFIIYPELKKMLTKFDLNQSYRFWLWWWLISKYMIISPC